MVGTSNQSDPEIPIDEMNPNDSIDGIFEPERFSDMVCLPSFWIIWGGFGGKSIGK